jgi:hypothetical protein
MSNSTNEEHQTQGQKNTRGKLHNFVLLCWLNFCGATICAIIGIALIVISILGHESSSALIRNIGIGIVIGLLSSIIPFNFQFFLKYLMHIIRIGNKEKKEKRGGIASAQSKQADEGREKKQGNGKEIGRIVFIFFGLFSFIVPLGFVIIREGKPSALEQVSITLGMIILIPYISRSLDPMRGGKEKGKEDIIEGDKPIANKEPDEGLSEVKVMREIGIEAIFKGRNEGVLYEKIKPLFEEEKEIDIYGISLRDFFYDGLNPKFMNLWEILKRRLEKKENSLRIRILIINPQCRGAMNRKNADRFEEKNEKKSVGTSYLYRDVGETIDELMELMEKISKEGCGEIQLRLSNCDPLMFMIQTKKVSFVQQHLFGSIPQDPDGIVPILEYKGTERDNEKSSCHGALRRHFDYIWAKASTDISEYNKSSIGFDRAIIEAGIKNAYYRHEGKNENETCRDRIISLINDEKTDTIWIRGVSLGSFFYNAPADDECSIYNALKAKCLASAIDLRVIVIDYNSDIAKERALRESNDPQRTLVEFANTNLNDDNEKIGEYWTSRLYRETRGAIKAFYRLKDECGKNNSNLQIRSFDGNPEGFFFITNKSALVEQYHFGRRGGANANKHPSAVPRTEVPVFEYAADKNQQMHELFKSHFEWLFEHSERVPRRED